MKRGLLLGGSAHSRIATAVAVLPALLMLTLFYSLALHMHDSLGAWPTAIGEISFPKPLITHGSIAVNYFIALCFITIFVWPVALLLCALVPRWRIAVPYLAVYAFACLACLGAMLLAPARFLNWWWD